VWRAGLDFSGPVLFLLDAHCFYQYGLCIATPTHKEIGSMEKKKITIELDEWQLEQVRTIINALKDFNRATDEKCDIDYSLVRSLDGADTIIWRLSLWISPASRPNTVREAGGQTIVGLKKEVPSDD
jgi:hypothetical protein